MTTTIPSPPSSLPSIPAMAGLKREQSIRLEYELRQILDELDSFQRKVEASDNADLAANDILSQDLERLLSRLDDFQQKIERADQADILSIQHLLAELDQKMNVGEANASNVSKSTKRERRKKSAETQLELYRRAKARAGWKSFDSPQGIIIQNVLKRKQRKSWLTAIFGGDENEVLLDPSDDEMEEMLKSQQVEENTKDTLQALRRSNQGLKETVVMLENKIKKIETTYKDEIATYQTVIMRLQQENIELHLRLEDLEKGQGSIYPEKEASGSSSPSYLSTSPSLKHTMSALLEMEKNRSAPVKTR